MKSPSNIHRPIITFLCLAAFLSTARADLKLASAFGNHAVLQQGASVPVWGWDRPGQAIAVKFAGQEKSATAGADGRWMVRLDSLQASNEGRELIVTGSNTIKFADVLVGEVWILGGQSNMLFAMGAAVDGPSDIRKATDPAIRYFSVDSDPADDPQTMLPRGEWQVGSPDTVKTYSAVGYHFARKVRDELGVPIGLICTAYNGVKIQTFIPLATLETIADAKSDVEKYDRLIHTWTPETAHKEYEQQLAKYEKDLAAFEQLPPAQQKPENRPMKPREQAIEPRKNPNRPYGLYNARIAPLMPYAIRGALWYQGEGNGFGNGGYLYRQYLPALIGAWRAAWGQGDFPFLFVQLPNFDWGSMSAQWPILRESMLIASRTPNTAMAVTVDVGEPKNLHPRNKKPVGQRLALAALHIAYGKDVVYSGPLFHTASFGGGKATIRFTSIGGGLVCHGDTLAGFEIAGADRNFVAADASIVGDAVTVSSPQVPEPAAVRYAWAPSPPVSLYNRDGLPASPFRTDDWPLPGQSVNVTVSKVTCSFPQMRER